jgi:hypothetical protein
VVTGSGERRLLEGVPPDRSHRTRPPARAVGQDAPGDDQCRHSPANRSIRPHPVRSRGPAPEPA